jgi:uncharacterized membrane protein YgaE (UPF0421/DUF939 family)
MRIGLRIWKTGIATGLTLLIAGLITGLDPIIAVIATIISLQPSVAESVKRGWHRIQATLIGAFIGITLGYLALHAAYWWPVQPALVGFGVVLAIVINNRLKIQDGAVIGAIAVVATMVGITESVLASGGYRLASTLLGIIVATSINLVFIPPQYRPTLIDEFKSINEEISQLFQESITCFISCSRHDLPKTEQKVEELKEKLEKIKQHLSYYKDELGYRRYLTNLPKLVVKEVVIFDKTIKTLDLILDRIFDIAQTTDTRIKRKSGQKKVNAEYGKLLRIIVQMGKIINCIQNEIITLLITYDSKEAVSISNQLKSINRLKSLLHQSMIAWHFTHQTEDNLQSLMEFSIIAYDIEQTADYLERLAKKVILINEKQANEKLI